MQPRSWCFNNNLKRKKKTRSRLLRNSICVSLSISRGWEVQVPTFRARKATHHTHSQGGGGVNLLLFGLSFMFIQNLFLHYSLQCVKVVILHLWQSGSVTSFPFHILKQLHLLNRHSHTQRTKRFTSAKSFSLKEQALLNQDHHGYSTWNGA